MDRTERDVAKWCADQETREFAWQSPEPSGCPVRWPRSSLRNMARLIFTGVLCVLGLGCVYWISAAALHKLGVKTLRHRPASERRLLWLFVGTMLLIAAFLAWGVASHHVELAIFVVIGFLAAPQLLLISRQLRRSRSRTSDRGARRRGGPEDHGS